MGAGPRMRMQGSVWAGRWVVAALTAWVAMPAHALFSDDEARRAILDLRQRVEAQRTATEEAIKRLQDEASRRNADDKQRSADEVSTLRRSLLELQNQIEALRADLAALRGQNEQLARAVAEVQQRQKDLATGQENRLASLDERLRRLEPAKVSLDGIEFTAEPGERRDFEAALAVFRQGDFNAAAAAFASFVGRYPASGYTGSAQFWLGNARYAARDYKEALAAFRALVTRDPNHQRVPEAQLAMANCLVELKDARGARKVLEDLVRDHPKTEAAGVARERLARLR